MASEGTSNGSRVIIREFKAAPFKSTPSQNVEVPTKMLSVYFLKFLKIEFLLNFDVCKKNILRF